MAERQTNYGRPDVLEAMQFSTAKNVFELETLVGNYLVVLKSKIVIMCSS